VTRSLSFRPVKFWLIGLIGLALATGAQAEDLQKLKLRQFIHSADKICHWLNPAEALALGGGLIQMRNSALVSGQSPQTVYAAIAQARRSAARVDCRQPDLLTEVETIRGAYRGFVARPRLTFDGPRARWLADRTGLEAAKWRLVQYQNSGKTRLAFGLYGRTDRHSLTVMAQFPDNQRPYSARLMVRDAKYHPSGLINPAPLGLSARRPVTLSDQDQAFVAQSRSVSDRVLEDGPEVNLAGFAASGEYRGRSEARPTLRFDFPIEATTAIARLDPREDIIVVFEFADGPQYARFEAGDFVPALVFATLPSPYGH